MIRAIIGDSHGCFEEFEELIKVLLSMKVDEIWHAGDLVDRGPDSGKTVQVAIDYQLKGVMGNHEQSIIRHWDSFQRTGNFPHNPAKARTLRELKQHHVDYMKTLPYLHVFDDQNLVLVHGGLWPSLELWKQPDNVCRAQMILPYVPERPCRWWGPESTKQKSGKTEEQNYADGYRRWYHVYDGKENVAYGHSVFVQPMLHQNKDAGWTCGLDTGNVFGGVLTAGIFEGDKRPYFICIPPKKVYCEDKLDKFQVR